MTYYEEFVKTHTELEIKQKEFEFRSVQNTLEANLIRTAYIMHLAAEVEDHEYNTNLLEQFLIEENVYLDGVKMFKDRVKPDGTPLIEWSRDQVSNINGFLKARYYLMLNHTNGILPASLIRKDENIALEATDEEQYNSYIMFQAYCRINEEVLTRKYAELLESRYPAMVGSAKSFETGKNTHFEEKILSLYEEWKMLEDPAEKEAYRIHLKGFFICLYCFNKFKKNYETARLFLDKAFEITNAGEIEYNIIRFLTKELRLEEAGLSF